jgi:hypothetical protein
MRWILAILFGWTALFPLWGQEATKCAACGKVVAGRFFLVVSPMFKEKQPVCESCSLLETTCFACDLPTGGVSTNLGDGRILCARDAAGAVFAQAEAERIFEEVRRDLIRILSGLGLGLKRRATILLIDGRHMQSLSPSQRALHDPNKTMGLTRTERATADELEHTIYLLNGLSRERLAAVAAHEYAHAWLFENLPEDRALRAGTVEGFCEWIAFKLMSEHGDDLQKRTILANLYARDQLQALLAAEESHGFYRVVEWIKRGADEWVNPADLGRVLTLKQSTNSAPGSASAWTPALSTRVPDTLQLKGISGRAPRRFALINDQTFSSDEKGRVRVGSSNVSLRCLEILDRSVIVQINGATQRVELFLRDSE